MTFSDFNLHPSLTEALAAMRITVPTAVQEAGIPEALAGKNIAVQSETGTGKTLAFLLPIFTRLHPGPGSPRAMIVCPTHELAAQTFRVAEKLEKTSVTGIKTALFLGTVALTRQYEMLKNRPDLVIGTAGRLAELFRLEKIDPRALEILVLDEADRLFSKDLIDPTVSLIRAVPAKSNLWMYSATITRHSLEKAMSFKTDMQSIVKEGATVLQNDIEHICLFAERRDKIDTIRRFEHAVKPARCLIFARTSGDVLNTLMKLRHSGIPCEALHGDFDSDTRRDALDAFREGKVRYLVTSDVGARGLDIENVSHIIMLDPPDSRESFIHRAGRTGRAGKKGVSIILADGYDIRDVSSLAVKFGIKFKVKKLHSGELFDITLEEFFGEAHYSLVRKRQQMKEKRKGNQADRRENDA